MPTPTVINKYRYSDSISRREWDNKYFSDQFEVNPMSCAIGGGAASGVTGHANVLYSRHGSYEWNVIGTQTILAPSLIAYGASGADTPVLSGLNLVQDQTNGDGIELCIGQSVTNPVTKPNPNPASFIIGSDAAFYMTGTFTTQDASGTNPLFIGFRKAQAFDATLTNYTDYATIGIVGTSNPNLIKTQTQIGSGGNVPTDTTQTWADDAIHTLTVLVSNSGDVTYQIDGLAPTVSVPYTFTSGLVVIPFIRFTNAADVTTYAVLSNLEIGFQS